MIYNTCQKPSNNMRVGWPIFVITLLFYSMSLVGCASTTSIASQSVTPTNLIQVLPSSTITPSKTSTLPAATPMASMTSNEKIITTTTTPLPIPSSTINGCMEEMPALPSNAQLSDSLLLSGWNKTTSFIYDFRTGNELAIDLPEAWVGNGIISPKNDWLATTYVMGEDSGYVQLVMMDNDGQYHETIQLEKKENEYFGLYAWLDNQYLLINREYYPPLYTDPPETQTPYSYAVMVLDPFTGERREFAPDYPEICQCASSRYPHVFESSYFALDPFLEMVVYPQQNSTGYYVTLWDIQKKQAVAQVKDEYSFGHDPLWAQDGSYFVVPVTVRFDPKDAYNYDDDERVLEWFQVSRQGDVLQLTHYADLYTQMQIGDASFSPDGRLLAFWLRIVPGTDAKSQLVVLNLETQHMVNYCVSGSLRPQWSPDSRYLAVDEQWFTVDGNDRVSNARSILVDTVDGWVAQIAENAVPMGWMKSP